MAKPKALSRISLQAVGAYGERVVEAELLRHGWLTANTNAGIKNAAAFDILARKDGVALEVRVKTCGPGVAGFTYGVRPGQSIKTANLGRMDFTILVRMGDKREDDKIYVVPTRVVWKLLSRHRSYFLHQPRRDGHPKKDGGRWVLRFAGQRSDKDPGHGVVEKWKDHLDNWAALDGGPSTEEGVG